VSFAAEGVPFDAAEAAKVHSLPVAPAVSNSMSSRSLAVSAV
jgi:hypothetical protein